MLSAWRDINRRYQTPVWHTIKVVTPIEAPSDSVGYTVHMCMCAIGDDRAGTDWLRMHEANRL